jgi:hypothetical protein
MGHSIPISGRAHSTYRPVVWRVHNPYLEFAIFRAVWAAWQQLGVRITLEHFPTGFGCGSKQRPRAESATLKL